MIRSATWVSRSSLIGRGSIAGVLATILFAALHHLLISPIWSALPVMLAAGAASGAALAWSYTLVRPAASLGSWWRFNLMFLVMFLGLGVVSMTRFSPVTTIPALLSAGRPPTALIGRALPMTGWFALGATAVFGLLYRPGWLALCAVAVTIALLVLLLGLNISILGLVEVAKGERIVLLETFGLLAVLTGSYAGLLAWLGRLQFQVRTSA